MDEMEEIEKQLKEAEGVEPETKASDAAPDAEEPKEPGTKADGAAPSPDAAGKPSAPGDPAKALKEKNREISELRKQIKGHESKVNQILEALRAKAEKDAPPEPDLDKEPVEYVRRREQVNEERYRQLAERQRFIETENFRTQVNETGRGSYQDWDAATADLQTRLKGLYEDLGFEGVDAHNQMVARVTEIILGANERGKNPAEVIYNTAKRMGYAANGNGDQNATKKLEAIKGGVTAAKSLAATGGNKPGKGNPSAAEILKMSPEELAAFTDGIEGSKNWKAVIEALEAR